MAFMTVVGGVSITSTGTTPLAEIAWSDTADGGLTSPVCILHFTASDTDAVDVNVFDTAAASIIGSVTIGGGTGTGIASFAFTVPAGDTTLILEADRPAAAGSHPVILGARAEFVD
jgi:hypothetical protein